MIQLTSRTTSLSYNDAEREEINSLLEDFQKNNGSFSTLKELFKNALQTKPTNQETLLSKIEELESLIQGRDLEISNLHSQISEHDDLKTELEKIKSEKVENTSTTSETTISFELDENELLIAKTINQNRVRRARQEGYPEAIETLSETVKGSFFNEGNVYNWHGNYFTGLGG